MKEKILKPFYDPFTLATVLNSKRLFLQPVEFTLDKNDGIFKISGHILKKGIRTATVGGRPNDLSWFEKVFYG